MTCRARQSEDRKSVDRRKKIDHAKIWKWIENEERQGFKATSLRVSSRWGITRGSAGHVLAEYRSANNKEEDRTKDARTIRRAAARKKEIEAASEQA